MIGAADHGPWREERRKSAKGARQKGFKYENAHGLCTPLRPSFDRLFFLPGRMKEAGTPSSPVSTSPGHSSKD